jgi:co-chaperonin GroES (HSP10)|tara:strand:- start:36 stop:302 length:267 start_codon:yes stop_codon:yes gene_type:complete
MSVKAIGNYIVVKPEVEQTITTKSGLMVSAQDKSQIRYARGGVVSIGEMIDTIKVQDIVWYDKHNGHPARINGEAYIVVSLSGVVVVE